MAQLWDQTKAKTLLDNGYITPERYAASFPVAEPMPDMSLDPAPFDPVIEPMPMPMPMPIAEEPMLIAEEPMSIGGPPAMNAAESMGNAYEKAYTSTPVVTTTDGLGQRDASITNAYAAAYGDKVEPRSGSADGQTVAYKPDGVQNLEPAVPSAGQMSNPTLQIQQQMTEFLNPYEIQQNAVLAAARSGEAAAREESSYTDTMQKKFAAQVEQNIKDEENGNKKLEGKMLELEGLEKSHAAKKIDPDRYWSNKTTGEKIGLGIAMFLGAVGAGKAGTNAAAQSLTDTIKRDIEIQALDIRTDRESINSRKGLYTEMRSMFRDHQSAKSAMLVQGLNVAQLKLNSIAAKYKGTEQAAKASILWADLEQKKQTAKMQFQDSMRRAITLQNLQNGGMSDINQLPEKERERAVGDANRFYGLASSASGAEAARKFIPTFETARDGIKELIDIANQARLGKISPSQVKAVMVKRQMIMSELREPILGPGTVQEAERELIAKIVADPMKIFSLGNESKALEALYERLTIKLRISLQPHNLHLPEERRKMIFNEQPVEGGA